MDEKNVPILDSEQLVDRIYYSVRGNGNERFCFILGSGACATSGIPAGGKLEYDWMQELMGETPVNGRCLAPERTKELAKKFWGDAKRFDEIADHWEKQKRSRKTELDGKYYFDIFDLREYITQQNGQRLLEGILERDEVFPSYGYITLAMLLADGSGSNLVLTTNFDNLVERALYMYTNAVPITINHEALAAFIDEPNLKRPLIGKIHRGSHFKTLNKPQEVDKLQGNWGEILDDIFLTYTPIVIGYSGNDKSLMSYLEEHTLRNGIIWCAHKKEPDNKRIRAAVKKSNGCFVLHNGFDDLMTQIGNLVFGDEVVPQKVFDELKKRTDGYCDRLSKSYQKFTDPSESPELPESLEPLGLPKPPKPHIPPESSAAAELRIKTEEEDAKREKTGTLTAMDYFRRANEFAKQRNYEEAIENYTEGLKLDPKFVAAYNNRGNAYGDKGEYDKAIEDYNKAIELDQKLATAYNNRGCVYDDKKEYDKAIEDYNKAIELDPKYAIAYNNRGNAYGDKGEYDKAIEDYTKAIKLNPHYAIAYNNRGVAYKDKGECDKALADYDKALELAPDYKKAKENRDRVLELLRKEKQ